MFANRNNHLLKKLLKGGGIETPFAEIPSLVKTLPFSMDLSPEPIPVDPYDMPAPPIETSTADYPDTNYLYKNITSNKDVSKINVCAFNKGEFIKYIVQEEDGRVIFPSFVFENVQRGGFLDGDSAPTDLDNMFKQKVEEFVKTFFSQTDERIRAMLLPTELIDRYSRISTVSLARFFASGQAMALPRFELRLPDSKSGVITNYTIKPLCLTATPPVGLEPTTFRLKAERSTD